VTSSSTRARMSVDVYVHGDSACAKLDDGEPLPLLAHGAAGRRVLLAEKGPDETFRRSASGSRLRACGPWRLSCLVVFSWASSAAPAVCSGTLDIVDDQLEREGRRLRSK